jgi:hypothetical protein
METVATCWHCGTPSADGLLCPTCMETLVVCRETVAAAARMARGGRALRGAVLEIDGLLRATEPERMESLVARRRGGRAS